MRSARPLGPAARNVNVFSAPDRPLAPPAWRVRFWDRHVELLSDNAEVLSTDTVNEVPTLTAALSSSPVICTTSSSSQRTTESNYAIGQWCKRIFDEIVTEVSSAGADPKVGPEIKKLVAKFASDTAGLLAKGARKTIVPRLGTEVRTSMRQSRPGPGSNKRAKGAYG